MRCPYIKKIVISASGGGHTGYAVALAQRLEGKAEIIFIVPQNDKWSELKVKPFGKVFSIKKARGPKDSLIKAIPNLISAFWDSLHVIDRSFNIFVSSGSNHSVPPAFAAKLRGYKIINIESSVRFTKPSLSVRVLKYISDITVLQWPEQKNFLPEGIVVGPLFEKPLYPSKDKGYILVTGGTYGHKKLFDAISKLNYDNVVLQTGRINPKSYKKRHPRWIIFDFDPDFQRWIAGASLVISHLGKTVIDAALTYRKPVIIVPNPEWKLTAGWKDAEILAEKINALLIKKISTENIAKAIIKAKGKVPPQYPDGAERLAKMIIEEF